MVDFNVDNLLYNMMAEKEWCAKTKSFIKYNGYKKMLDKFLKAAEEVAEEYYKGGKGVPRSFFKGDYKITEIADEFRIKPLGRKLRLCPFHKDKAPSLSLSNEKGLFNCFGCGAKGNLIKFHAMLKKVKKSGNN